MTRATIEVYLFLAIFIFSTQNRRNYAPLIFRDDSRRIPKPRHFSSGSCSGFLQFANQFLAEEVLSPQIEDTSEKK